MADVERQRGMKVLARLADERWKSKPSFLDKPKDGSRQQPGPGTLLEDKGGYGAPDGPPRVTERSEGDRVVSPVAGEDGRGGLPPLVPHGGDLPEGSGVVGEGRAERQSEGRRKKAKEKNPWSVNRGGPSEEWQPEAWDPGALKPRTRGG